MSRADDLGTALTQALPWFDAIDALATAARALLDGTGSEADLALALHNYRQTAAAVLGEPSEAPEGKVAYEGLSKLSYRG